MLSGELTPREFTFRIHQRYGNELPLTERLAELDDEYDVPNWATERWTRSMPRSRAEAHRLAAHPTVPADPRIRPVETYGSTREFPLNRLRFSLNPRGSPATVGPTERPVTLSTGSVVDDPAREASGAWRSP